MTSLKIKNPVNQLFTGFCYYLLCWKWRWRDYKTSYFNYFLTILQHFQL